MINSDVFLNNLKVLLDLKEGANLIADDKNQLRVRSPSDNKPNLLKNLFNFDRNKVDKVVNNTCQCLFNEITKNTIPLTSTSASLSKDRLKVKNILDRISKIGYEILKPQLKSDLQELVKSPETLEARLALERGLSPKVLNQTISGTYIMHNRLGKPWGIFKPKRQEVGGDKNPSWIVWANYSAERWGIESGTGYLRECAAYQLDKDHFSDVPLTSSTQFKHPVLDTSLIPLTVPILIGSFQSFKDNCQSGEASLKKYEYYPIKPNKLRNHWVSYLVKKIVQIFYRFFIFAWLEHIPVDQIHKMAILDIRILNCDRHMGNFLYHHQSKKLYPIDHGLILPANANRIRFEWMNLAQSHMPFSRNELAYIRNLNGDNDEKILQKCGLTSTAAIERMKLSTALLQAGAERGLTLYQIGDLMVGNNSFLNSTYFERVICKRILENDENPKLVISQVIDNYLKSTT